VGSPINMHFFNKIRIFRVRGSFVFEMLAIAPSVIVVLFISRMAFTDFAEIIIYYVIGLPKAGT